MDMFRREIQWCAIFEDRPLSHLFSSFTHITPYISTWGFFQGLFIWMAEWQGKKTEKQRSAGSLPGNTHNNQMKQRASTLNPGLPRRWQGPDHVGQPLLLSQTQQRKLNQKHKEGQDWNQHSYRGCGIPRLSQYLVTFICQQKNKQTNKQKSTFCLWVNGHLVCFNFLVLMDNKLPLVVFEHIFTDAVGSL